MAFISQDQLAELPTPDMITLLFKCHKSTTALSVLPTKPFTEIKALLLAALESRNLKTLPNSSAPLPDDPEELEFGVLADKKDPSKGWVPMDTKEQEIAGPKGAKTKIGGRPSVLNQNPLGAGLGDGAWIAYRLKARQKEPQVKVDENGTPDVEIDEDPGFDVILPSFEDEAE
ncbi:uncharacterized protein Z519_11367 [Cladophialophora bantiana CBS 173.52]|uniref:Uncharacterized protein n=1 Tax=Cladophialophora bantiana (strain ATCC 10958 / CBS 173.52 / CDC B-1940 / NIH 8579) TaxID=1442370 RepID=A0A0D2EDP5_CLAB1|nr:uncharacterized protein Z519_11367 [Cladophialophora bantiana CBS 173.52]KIW88256.1 hypothetical protein Z519_11367 [Cladophialophora bantiana CBS 173.52]